MENKRIAVKLKPAAERMAKKKHPWVFEGGIVKLSHKGEAGDLAIVFDNKKNKFLACGLYDPYSPIRIKLIQFHKGSPINQEWFKYKVKEAYLIRRPLFETKTNSYRLIFGESDGLPGLIADVYADVLVVKLYSAIWFPYLDLIVNSLIEYSGCTAAVLRLSRIIKTKVKPDNFKDGQVIYGELKSPEVEFLEHGLKFKANVLLGHKTGYFLDHRHNRKQIGKLSKSVRVLDVFSYAGGFSVHALAAGAKEVHSIDISEQALKLAKANAALNPHKGKHFTYTVDAFEGLKKMVREGKGFDVVVIDPPSFAKRESEVEQALISYQRLAKLGARLTYRGGILVLASCSSRVSNEAFFEACLNGIISTNQKYKMYFQSFHDIDHPVNESFPEAAYLKCAYFKLL